MEQCTVREPLSRVYHIETPGNVFVTLLVGQERALLVDTGLGLCDLQSVVRGISTLPLTVVNTHGHNDHISGNYQFPEVLLSSLDIETAKFSLSRTIRENVVRIRQAEEVPDGYWAYELGNIGELADGATFDLGGMHAQAVSLPNHTPGSMGFLIPELGLLIGGDSVSLFTSLFFPEASTVSEHISVLQKADGLEFDHILSSHSGNLYPKKLLELLSACAENYDPAKTIRYRDQYFSEYKGRLFYYQSPDFPDEAAILAARP